MNDIIICVNECIATIIVTHLSSHPSDLSRPANTDALPEALSVHRWTLNNRNKR